MTQDVEHVEKNRACPRYWPIPRHILAADPARVSPAPRQIPTLTKSHIRISDFGLPSDFGIRFSDFSHTLGHLPLISPRASGSTSEFAPDTPAAAASDQCW